jgi:hypothetical protein
LLPGYVTVNLGVETEPFEVVTTSAPDRAPTGIVTVIEVGVIKDASDGFMFMPFNFTLKTELKPVPLIVTVVPTVPEGTDSPPGALIRGNSEREDV